MSVQDGTLDGELLRAAVQVAQVDRAVEGYKRKKKGVKPFATPEAARGAYEAALARGEAAA